MMTRGPGLSPGSSGRGLEESAGTSAAPALTPGCRFSSGGYGSADTGAAETGAGAGIEDTGAAGLETGATGTEARAGRVGWLGSNGVLRGEETGALDGRNADGPSPGIAASRPIRSWSRRAT